MTRNELIKKSKDVFENAYQGNEKIKYINNLDKSNSLNKVIQITLIILGRLSEYEKKMELSILDMSKEQILNYLKEIKSKNITVIKSYSEILKSYIEFLDETNCLFDEITQENLLECIDKEAYLKKYITEKNYLSILKLRDSDSTINYQDLGMVVLLWRGVRGNEYLDIANFRKKDFNYEKCEIYYKSRVISLLPIESEILRKCIEETTYRHYATASREEKIVNLVAESENIFKETEHFNANSKLSYSSIKIRLSYFIREKIKDIMAIDIYRSGVIYNVLKENDFKKMRVVDLDTKIKQAYQKISYNHLKELQDEILNKIEKEQIGSQ